MRINVAWLFSTAASLLVLSGHIEAGTTKHVAVIYSDTASYTVRTISGLEWSLQGSKFKCEITKYLLKDQDEANKSAIESGAPDLLVTIGSRATSFADKEFPKLPIVFAKVLNPLESGFIQTWDKPGRHLTGASLDISPELQMQKFVAVVPNLKKIGVIYTDNTKRLTDAAKQAAASLGIQLIPYKVSSSKDLPGAIDSLCRSVDAIWTVADEELSTPQFIKYMLLETLRHRIPIMGFNQSFVESGALLCLEADYKYIGRQAADIAVAVLNGAEPSRLKPTVPDIVYLYLNLKTSKLLNIDLPPELVNVAKETY